MTLQEARGHDPQNLCVHRSAFVSLNGPYIGIILTDRLT